MKKNKITYKNFIQKKYLDKKLQQKLNKNYLNIFNKISKSLDLSFDPLFSLSKKYKLKFKTQDLKKFKKFKTIIVVGMGGSILGSEAIYCFLNKKIKKKFIFLNDIDEEKLKELKNNKNLKSFLFIVISKSGNTIETLSNLLALQIIKKDSKNLIIISEKTNNPLYSISKKMNLLHIEHKKSIGGRFSVFSDVGMVPAYFMGLNLINFRQKLLVHLSKKNKNYLKNSVIAIANLFQRKKFKNLILLNYSPRLEKFLFWSQQLIAESLGKKGKGFLPLISQVPKDHHSLLQLYSDGPKDKIYYIFSEKNKKGAKIHSKNLNKQLKFLNNKNLNLIKNFQKDSLIKLFKEKQIPFREFEFNNQSEQVLGELFSYFILETVLIAKLSDINPFDQPGVEQVKKKTKQLLN